MQNMFTSVFICEIAHSSSLHESFHETVSPLFYKGKTSGYLSFADISIYSFWNIQQPYHNSHHYSYAWSCSLNLLHYSSTLDMFCYNYMFQQWQYYFFTIRNNSDWSGRIYKGITLGVGLKIPLMSQKTSYLYSFKFWCRLLQRSFYLVPFCILLAFWGSCIFVFSTSKW